MLPTGSLVHKDPTADHWPRGVDWTMYLARIDAGETITTSTWSITGRDTALVVDLGSPTIVTGSLKTQLRLSAGTGGLTYNVSNTILTSSGITDRRSFKVKIRVE